MVSVITNSQKAMIAFGIIEALLIIFICLATFVPEIRKAITGRNVSSREDAKNKGYGYYSDPIVGQCFSETGNCQTEGTQYVYRKCIPNFSNGNDGVGCVDSSTGLFTYNMIIDEQPCKQQCFSANITIDDNVNVNTLESGVNVVTGVGTHQLLDTITGVDMSNTFIGDFDITDMTYNLKNCIDDRTRYQGYKTLEYKCKSSSDEGIDGCVYICGSNATPSFGRSFSREDGTLIIYPSYTSEDGQQIFYCNDIQDNNRVEILNQLTANEPVPSGFVLPDMCYSHANIGNPPSTSVTFELSKESYNYLVDDPYLFVDKSSNFFSDYFDLDYNILGDPHSYVKLFVNGEWRLLSRYYVGSNGITSFIDYSGVNIGYVPYPANNFNIDQLKVPGKINLYSDETGEIEIEMLSDEIFQDTNFIYVPFDVVSGFFEGVAISTGTYFYDPVEGTIRLYSDSFELNKTIVAYMYFEGKNYLSRFQLIDVTDDKNVLIDFTGGNDNLPEPGRGNFSYYSLPDEDYSVSASGSTGQFNIHLYDLPLTGSMFVSSFISPVEDSTQQGYLDMTVSDTVAFYIYGTPLSTYPNEGVTGFYYPLYLSQVDPDKTYKTYKFVGYQNTSFYLPVDDVSGEGVNYVYGNYSNYDYLRGTGIVGLSLSTISLDITGQDIEISYWNSPQVLTTGTGYQTDIYYPIRGKDAKVKPVSLTELDEPHNILETARVGNDRFSEVDFISILEDQTRNTTDNVVDNYSVTVYPEKVIQLTHDFTQLKGPYITRNGKKDYICVNSDGTPVEDGTQVNFYIGETVVINEIDNDFNTNIPAFCGDVTLVNRKICQQPRTPSSYNLSSDCITYNPDGEYFSVDSFLERGFLLGNSNKLLCYDTDDNLLDDDRCQQPFLTDYWESGKQYSSNEELLLNRPDTNLYISLRNGNTNFPDASSWSRVSQIQDTSFNIGQYFGEDETYRVVEAGDIYMKPGRQLDYLTYLEPSLPEEFDHTNSYGPYNFDEFRTVFNLITPLLVKQITQTRDVLHYTLKNSDVLNPVLTVTLDGLPDKNVIHLEENYLNGLIWYLSSYNFLNVNSSDVDDLTGANFSKVGLNDNNNIGIFNSITRTTLPLGGTNRADLSGYYCWFIPMIFDNNNNGREDFNALYPRQWIQYIYHSARSAKTQSFEVVYVVEYQGDNIVFDRNITDSPYFRFIDPTLNEGDEYGFFLPFSTNGPVDRIHQLSSTGTFEISFNFPTEYTNFIAQIANKPTGINEVDIYNSAGRDLNDMYSFFCYGYNGFVVDNNIKTPSYTNGVKTVVQYEPNRDRNKSISIIQRIRVDSNQNIYINEIKDSGTLTYRIGDQIVFSGYIFVIVGTEKKLLKSGSTNLYENFDYQCEPIDDGFFDFYTSNGFGQSYLNINNGGVNEYLVLPTYNDGGTWRFVLYEYYNFLNTEITITLSAVNDPLVSVGTTTITDSSLVFFLGFIPASAPTDTFQYQQAANLGNLTEARLQQINLSERIVLKITQIIGKPAGKYSVINSPSTSAEVDSELSYTNLIRGRSFITGFTVDFIETITENTKFTIDGYNFGIEDGGNLASVNLSLKTYTDTDSIPTYDGTKTRFVYGDLVYFKDYKTNFLFRNGTDVRQEFDPDKIDDGIWQGNGAIHPQVNFKLYHSDQVYVTGDLVRYDGELWRADVNIGLSSGRTVPKYSDDWSLFVPSGTLFSNPDWYIAIQSDMNPENPSLTKSVLTIIGDTHQFHRSEFYYNKRYRYLFAEDTPIVYFASGVTLLDEKYNFVSGNFIMEIRYFLSGIETTRTNFINNFSTNDDEEKEIEFVIRRSSSSLITATPVYEQVDIRFSDDSGSFSDTREITFYNNNQELTQEIIANNRLNNQNIPFRIGNFDHLGYCMEACIKNIDNDAYTTTAFSFIDLITDNLVDTFFNNNIFSYVTNNNFITLSNEPCNINYGIEDRFLQPCIADSARNITQEPFYSQYLYQIPKLTRDAYGLDKCDSDDDFIFANALLFLYIPMDIDSQNFLRYTYVSSEVSGGVETGILNSSPYFLPNTLSLSITPSQSIVKQGDGTYTTTEDTITITRLSGIGVITYLTENGPFTNSVLSKTEITMAQGNDKITLKPTKFGLSYSIDGLDFTGVNNYDYWWASALPNGTSDRKIFEWGFVYENSLQTLSYTEDLEIYEPIEGLMNFYVSDDNTVRTFNITFGGDGKIIRIRDFEIVKQTSFSQLGGSRIFTATDMSGLSVNVFFGTDGYMYQHGDSSYSLPADKSSNLDTGSYLYFKLFGDECLTKLYANISDNESAISYYPTTIAGNDGVDYFPLVFNMNKSGILDMEDTQVSIQSGDEVVTTDQLSEVFSISDGLLKAIPINQPFTINNYATFTPAYVTNQNLGVIASGSSPQLYTESFNGFSSVVETNTTDFPLNLAITNVGLDNAMIRQLMLRDKYIRNDYPDEGLICRYIGEVSGFGLGQGSLSVIYSDDSGLYIRGEGENVSFQANLFLVLDQSSDGNFPFSFSVDGTIITDNTTAFGNQYLVINYTLDGSPVSRTDYMNKTKFNGASVRLIRLIYETPLTGDTVPNVTEIDTIDTTTSNSFFKLIPTDNS